MDIPADCSRIDKAKLGPSSIGMEPCHLCALVASLTSEINALATKIEKMPEMVELKNVKRQLGELRASHNKCPGCGLCYDGDHIARPMEQVKGLGRVCQWCAQDIKRYGLEHFLKASKRQGNGEKVV